MEDAERLRGFLQDLAALTEQYQLEIGGCGECGSPWVQKLAGDKQELLVHLEYDKERKIYAASADLRKQTK